MTLSFNITKITKDQWKGIGKVALWLLFSIICSLILAFVTQNPLLFGTTAPVFNIVGVAVQKLFTQQEVVAISQLPAALQAPVKQAVDEISTAASTEINADPPTAPPVAAPVPANGIEPSHISL